MEKQINVLHLEDDPADAELVQSMLESADLVCQVTRVQTRDEFTHALDQADYDIILADYNLPGYDGISALWLAHQRLPDVPLIMVSGVLGEDAAIESLLAGATDYVLKGKISRLVPAVQRALREAELDRERKQAEARYRDIFENAVEGIYQSDPQGHFTIVNLTMARLFGYESPDDMLTTTRLTKFKFYADPQGRAQVIHQLERESKIEKVESECLRKDGRRIWISENARAVRDRHGTLLHFEGFVQDITDRKRAQAELEQSQKQLRELAGHLQSAREAERTAIAREIHDEIGQLLTGLKFDLVWLKTNFSPAQAKTKTPQSSRKITRMIRQTEATIASMRRIASAQRPPALHELGLDAALEWQAREFTQHTDIPCLMEITTRHPLALTDEQSTALFRIFQEALANTARHAHATQVQATLKEEASTLVLEIRDNGKGIAKRHLTDVRSFGISGMRERAMMLGGELKISGKRGTGTTIRVQVPLARASQPPSGMKGETS